MIKYIDDYAIEYTINKPKRAQGKKLSSKARQEEKALRQARKNRRAF